MTEPEQPEQPVDPAVKALEDGDPFAITAYALLVLADHMRSLAELVAAARHRYDYTPKVGGDA